MLAHLRAQSTCQFAAQNHPKTACLQLVQHLRRHQGHRVRDQHLLGWIDATHHRTPHVLALGEQSLRQHKRRTGNDLLMLRQFLLQKRRVLQRGTAVGQDLDV